MIFGKKGDGFKILNYGFWRILFISILFLVMFLMVISQIKSEINVDELSAHILYNRIINTEASYISPQTYRYYPGHIGSTDSDFFISEHESDRFSAKLSASQVMGDVLVESYVNKKWYDRYYPLISFKQYNEKLALRYVLINGESGLLEYRSVEKE